MKKLISLVLAGIMTFSLAACGQNATDNQTTAQNAQTTQSNEAQAAAAADSTQSTAEPMELTMYFPVSVGGGPDALIDALCAQYHEENPNITIKPVYAGSYADTRTKVQAAIKGGNTPDLAIMFSIDLYSLLAMDAIADINSFCTTDADKEWLNGFYEGFMMNSRDGETTYGIPLAEKYHRAVLQQGCFPRGRLGSGEGSFYLGGNEGICEAADQGRRLPVWY